MSRQDEMNLKSEQLYALYKKVTPGGVQSNFRTDVQHPSYFSKGKGPYVTDVDGNEYLDFIVGYGSLILGHGDKDVYNSVAETLQNGLVSGYETDLSYEVASMVRRMIPSAKRVRFANSGTEAVMHSLHMARAFTNRQKIMKFEGCYHGWYDSIAFNHAPPVNRTASRRFCKPVPDFYGLSSHSEDNIVVSPYNDAESARNNIRDFKNELAAVIVEPVAFNMGCVIPSSEFIHVLREETEKYSIPLIFDEIITGFRISPGGAQRFFKVTPDISVFGKAIANGFPLSAVTGREDIMEIASPGGKTAYAGTYNGNQVSLSACRATLSKIRNGKVQEYFKTKTKLIGKRVGEISEELKIPVRFQGLGGQFQVYFTDGEVYDYISAASTDRELYSKFRRNLHIQRVLFHPSYMFHHGITYSHTDKVIEKFLSRFKLALNAVMKAGTP
ncbi:MAG: aspartate aminotransferase family protein [Thermoplasmata archaeon]|nr:aspartate aminotransferase family protein [Candidatus Sysuiplasma jiujiangense]